MLSERNILICLVLSKYDPSEAWVSGCQMFVDVTARGFSLSKHIMATAVIFMNPGKYSPIFHCERHTGTSDERENQLHDT